MESVDYREGMLEAIGDALLKSARIEVGQRVLEVGSGAGAMARQISGLVGCSGEVVGVDISPELSALATRRAAKLENLRFLTADAQTVALAEHSFDRLVSRFGIMFFADASAALRHLHALLRTGASLHAAVWADVTLNPWADLVLGACRRHLDLPPRQARPTGAFAFSDAGFFGNLLRQAGFRDIEFMPWCGTFEVGHASQSMEEVARALLPPGVITTLFKKLDPSAQQALIRDVALQLEPFGSTRGVHMPGAAHIVRAIA